METAATPAIGPCLYRECRAPLQPQRSGAIVRVQLPAGSSFIRPRIVKRTVDALPTCKTRNEFQSLHVATAGNICFRRAHRYPRAILWRVVEDHKVVELQTVDLVKRQNDAREANLILRFRFPQPLQSNGIALADSTDADTINVFALTRNNDLHTITLSSQHFCQATVLDDSSSAWHTKYRPSSLSLSSPHRLEAASALDLLLSMSDGRIVRLTRQSGADGSSWTESSYHDGHWGSSLRGMFQWSSSNAIRRNGRTYDPNLALASSISPDQSHLITVCLDHTLRFWNLATGRLVASRDLLDVTREPQDLSRPVLDPDMPKALQVFEAQTINNGDQYYTVTLSPQEGGLFKIWAIQNAEAPDWGIRDLFPDQTLRVPDPDDGAMWSVLDFHVKSAPGVAGITFYIMLRLNRRCRVYVRQFENFESIATDWDSSWAMTAFDISKPVITPCPLISKASIPAVSVAEQWLSFLSQPDDFPTHVLEAALSAYANARRLPVADAKRPLRERLGSTVGAAVQLQLTASNVDSSQADRQVTAEWTHFWNILGQFNEPRSEPLSMALDRAASMVWVVEADDCFLLRDCNQMETIVWTRPQDIRSTPSSSSARQNKTGHLVSTPSSIEAVSTVQAALHFQANFSPDLQAAFARRLQKELWHDATQSAPLRLQRFYDDCRLDSEISDGQFQDLEASFRDVGGLQGISTDAILSVIRTVQATAPASDLVTTGFGSTTVISGARDMLAVQRSVLCGLLALVIFACQELKQDDLQSESLNAPLVFIELLAQLRKVFVWIWLADHCRPAPSGDEQTSGASATAPRPSTVLQNLFARDLKPRSFEQQTLSSAWTQSIGDLLAKAAGDDDASLARTWISVECDLVKNGNIALAASFELFLPSTAWAAYVIGRLRLAEADFTGAALLFEQAAFHLSQSQPSSSDYEAASASLLDSSAAALLASGSARYYTHIMNMFVTYHIYSQVAKFAQLALLHGDSEDSDASTEVLSHLFDASLALADYPTAFAALCRYTSSEHQQAGLSTLVGEMLSQHRASEFLTLPFATLSDQVDSILAERAQREQSLPLAEGVLPAFKILYAWRLQRGDMRGAAQVLVERLEARRDRRRRRRELSGSGNGNGDGDEQTLSAFGAPLTAERALDEYLVGINALALTSRSPDDGSAANDDADPEEGWVFVESRSISNRLQSSRQRKQVSEEQQISQTEQQKPAHSASMGRRRVVRLQDLRRAYQGELDRLDMYATGRFGILGGQDSDSDSDGDGDGVGHENDDVFMAGTY